MTGALAFGTALIGLILELVRQYFSYSAEQAAINKQYKFDEQQFDNVLARAWSKMRQTAREDAGQAGPVEDQLDAELAKLRKNPFQNK